MIRLHRKFTFLREAAVSTVKCIRRIYEMVTRRSLLKVHGDETVRVIGVAGYNSTFAGYYDVSPFRPSSKQIAVHATNWPIDSVPDSSATVDIFLYDLESGNAKYLDSTCCWNWQQGSRLQWINRNTLAFNKLVDSQIRAVLLNVEDRSCEILPTNLSIAFKDEYLISLDYNALSRCSEYGYAVADKRTSPEIVMRYTFSRKEATPLFDWREFCMLKKPGSTKEHINHIWPSPEGNSFVFVYRHWIGRQRYDSLLLFDFGTNTNKVLLANQTIGHYTWRNNSELLVWGVLDGQEGYFVLDTITSVRRRVSCLTDGHPNFLHQSAFAADIAPTFRKMPTRTLFVLDLEWQIKKDLITVSHPTILNEACRCDMHPSLSLDNAMFQVDSRHLYGKRTVIVGSLPEAFNAQR